MIGRRGFLGRILGLAAAPAAAKLAPLAVPSVGEGEFIIPYPEPSPLLEELAEYQWRHVSLGFRVIDPDGSWHLRQQQLMAERLAGPSNSWMPQTLRLAVQTLRIRPLLSRAASVPLRLAVGISSTFAKAC